MIFPWYCNNPTAFPVLSLHSTVLSGLGRPSRHKRHCWKTYSIYSHAAPETSSQEKPLELCDAGAWPLGITLAVCAVQACVAAPWHMPARQPRGRGGGGGGLTGFDSSMVQQGPLQSGLPATPQQPGWPPLWGPNLPPFSALVRPPFLPALLSPLPPSSSPFRQPLLSPLSPPPLLSPLSSPPLVPRPKHPLHPPALCPWPC